MVYGRDLIYKLNKFTIIVTYMETVNKATRIVDNIAAQLKKFGF
jgi:hypothetical protein